MGNHAAPGKRKGEGGRDEKREKPRHPRIVLTHTNRICKNRPRPSLCSALVLGMGVELEKMEGGWRVSSSV